jgi:membrane protein required for colicin V production
MIWVDYGLVVVILVSALVGLLRGFTRELLGLMTWVFAFAAAWLGSHWMDAWLEPHITAPSVRKGTAYLLLFLGALLVGGVITALVSGGIRDSRFSSTDRTLGAGLGLFRGFVICGLFILIAGQTLLRQDPWWSQSLLIKRLDWVAQGLGTLMPAGWLDAIRAESEPAPVPEAAPRS